MKCDQQRLNILVVYDANSIHVNTICEHLQSFANYSQHHIYYSPATAYVKCRLNMTVFDVIYIHYSVRINTTNTPHSLSKSYFEAVKKFQGFKVLFVQDEYETTDITKKHIHELGIHCVYTTVSPAYLAKVYPASQFSQVDFLHTLTGYVPESLTTITLQKDPKDRNITIGYRGRELPFWYGNLGREKLVIGQRMKEICQSRNIICDIEWTEDKRIYGNDWYEFLGNCRATLGTESGSNVFDFTGSLSSAIKNALVKNPALDYNTIYKKFLESHDGYVVMNQISPKIFEAIALHTALILFEGTYSNVIVADVHYIPLKKDFSNVDQVLEKVNDDQYIRELTQRAYVDIVASGKYSYQGFVAQCDAYLQNKKITENKFQLIATDFIAIQAKNSELSSATATQVSLNLTSHLLPAHSNYIQVRNLGYRSWNKFISAPFVLLYKIISHDGLIFFFKKINAILPGQPFTKIYYKLRARLKN